MRGSRLSYALALGVAMPLLMGGVDRSVALDSRILAAHNRERTAIGVPALQWDQRLAADAKAWAVRLAASGRLAHPGGGASGIDDSGENLWAGTRGQYAPEEMVGYWSAEKTDFNPGVFPNVSRTRNIGAVGHYTQMIWRKTQRVGCAVAGNARDEFLVCRYAAAGNVVGERPI